MMWPVLIPSVDLACTQLGPAFFLRKATAVASAHSRPKRKIESGSYAAITACALRSSNPPPSATALLTSSSAREPWLVSRRTILKHLVPIGQTLRQLLRRSWLALSAPPALRHPCTGLTYGAQASRSIPSKEPILSRCTIQELFSLPGMYGIHASRRAARARGVPERSGRGPSDASPAAETNDRTADACPAPSSTTRMPPGESRRRASVAIARYPSRPSNPPSSAMRGSNALTSASSIAISLRGI